MFLKEGYLSSDIHVMREQNLHENAELYDLVKNTVELANSTLYSQIHSKTDKKSAVVCALFCKSLDSYHSVILLSSYGLESDASSLVRVQFEATAHLGAIINDEAQYDQFLHKADADTKSIILRIRENPDSYTDELVKEAMNRDLEEYNESLKNFNRKTMEVYSIANKAGMIDIHRWLYNSLCNEVHTNFKSLKRYMVESGEEIQALDPTPKFTAQKYNLLSSTWIMTRAVKHLLDYSEKDDFTELEKIECRLNEAFKT